MAKHADIRVTVDTDRYEEAVAILEAVAIEAAKFPGVISARLRPGIDNGADEYATPQKPQAEAGDGA